MFRSPKKNKYNTRGATKASIEQLTGDLKSIEKSPINNSGQSSKLSSSEAVKPIDSVQSSEVKNPKDSVQSSEVMNPKDSVQSSCSICKEGVHQRDLLRCEGCSFQAHYKCLKMSEETFRVFVDNGIYFCEMECRRKARSMYEVVNTLVHSQDKLEESVEEIVKDLRKEASRIDELESKLLVFENQIKIEIGEFYKEKQDKDSRKLNIIVHGLKESEKKEAVDRKQDDIILLNEVFEEIGVKSVNVKSAIRLGKVDNKKHRLLKVVLDVKKDKHDILSNASKLRNNDRFSKVYISPDLTAKEREEDKKLRAELEKIREESKIENKKWVIKNKKIVCLDLLSRHCVEQN